MIQKTNKKRQSRYKPDYGKFPRVNIQDRDLKVIKEVVKDRFLTARQIQALFFNSYSAAQRRLQKLWNKGYLKREYIPIRPDRFIGLKINALSNYYFLEVDRGSAALKECARKLRGLREYYFSGGFFKKYGEQGYRKEDYSYRVLITAPTQERRNNLVEKAIEQGSLEMCWLGLFSGVIQDPLGKVWIRGKEYKEVLESLVERQRERILRAHRKLERDEIIKERVNRRSILE
ncbi:hypothetical protein KAV79_05030 [Candidatus Aerophobetes bacterium]|nr:hypothetical protein [Candidatus Aerophobetes bacterium]